MRHSLPVLLAIPLLAAAAPPAPAASNAPALPPGLATPVPSPYDTAADAHRVVDAALAEGRRERRVVLIDFGGNWCPDCRMLSGVLAEPAMRRWLADHAVLATVDIGRFDRNTDIAARWGVPIRAAPTVLAIAPDGTLLDRDDPTALANDRSMSAQAVADQIAAWARSAAGRPA